MQVIFEAGKSMAYYQTKMQIQKLNYIVEQSEIWISKLKNEYEVAEPIKEIDVIIQIINTLRSGMYLNQSESDRLPEGD